jgi:hypothetical protein
MNNKRQTKAQIIAAATAEIEHLRAALRAAYRIISHYERKKHEPNQPKHDQDH